jgi:DNA repair protein RAD5
MSLLSQWDEQILLHAGGVLSTMVYYGQQRGKTASTLKAHDVVLTTYGTLASEHAVQVAIEKEELAPATRAAQPQAPLVKALSASAGRKPSPPLFATRWRRVVLDEAHAIKGRTTHVARATCALESERRWAVSGTPIQNHLDDLFALLHFLRLSPLGDYSYWSKAILTPLADRRDAPSMTAALTELRAALEPLMLRRTKATRDATGAPIVLLPPRVTNVEWLLFSDEERDFYDALRTQTKVRFDTFVAEGRVLNNYATVLHMLLQLRQACDHPYLVLARSGADADIGKIGARLLRRWEHEQAGRDARLSASASANFLERTLRELGEGGAKAALEEDGAAAGPASAASECVVCLDQYDDPVLTSCSHKFCRECILGCLGASGRAQCPICREIVERHDLVTVPGSRFTVDLDEHWRVSTKIEALMADLRSTLTAPLPTPAAPHHAPSTDGRAEESAVAKVVIVSQWTSMLNLVERPLDAEGLAYERLDGKLSQQARSAALRNFASHDGPRILLLSLRAGGVGLNLVAAQTLYLLDPWWNPAVEEQAVNRIHRIGQRYPVRIKRFLMQNSVEERIIQLQQRKEALAKGALGSADGEQEMQKMGLEDLKLLFQ